MKLIINNKKILFQSIALNVLLALAAEPSAAAILAANSSPDSLPLSERLEYRPPNDGAPGCRGDTGSDPTCPPMREEKDRSAPLIAAILAADLSQGSLLSSERLEYTPPDTGAPDDRCGDAGSDSPCPLMRDEQNRSASLIATTIAADLSQGLLALETLEYEPPNDGSPHNRSDAGARELLINLL